VLSRVGKWRRAEYPRYFVINFRDDIQEGEKGLMIVERE
jgi:hypothetical protein